MDICLWYSLMSLLQTYLLGTTFTQERLRRYPMQQPYPELPPPKLGDPASIWLPAIVTPGSTVGGSRRLGHSSERGPPSAWWARSSADHPATGASAKTAPGRWRPGWFRRQDGEHNLDSRPIFLPDITRVHNTRRQLPSLVSSHLIG